MKKKKVEEDKEIPEKNKTKKERKKQDKKEKSQGSEIEKKLEEKVEELEEDFQEFDSFIPRDIDRVAPVLEKINAIEPQITNLEEDLTEATNSQSREKQTRTYEPPNIREDYAEARVENFSFPMEVKTPRMIDIERVGRNLMQEIPEIDFRTPLQQARQNWDMPEEDYVPESRTPERIKLETNNLPFQEKERKYKGRPI